MIINDLCQQQNIHQYGGVAQLGEHLPCKQGVMGSNPIISTKPARAGGQTDFAAQNQVRLWKLRWKFESHLTHGLIAQQVRARA